MADKEIEKVELNEEDLDAVAGGYSTEEWNAMTPEQRRQEQIISIQNKAAGIHCNLDDE